MLVVLLFTSRFFGRASPTDVTHVSMTKRKCLCIHVFIMIMLSKTLHMKNSCGFAKLRTAVYWR